jgi:hypothetical protein
VLVFATYSNADRPSVGPLVLGVEPSPNISGIDWKELPEHREEGQVELDVNRSFVYYPTGRCIWPRSGRKKQCFVDTCH